MRKPILISHRGVHDRYPENTLESFTEAVRSGFSYLETDLRTTRDGEIVLAHDADLLRVAGRNVVVEECSRKELTHIRLSHGCKFAFLEEFLDHFGHLHCTFDIKPESGLATIQTLTSRFMTNAKFKDALLNRGRFLFWKRAQEAAFSQRHPQVSFYARQDQCMRTGLASLLGLTKVSGYDKTRVYSLPENFKGIPLFHETFVRRYQLLGIRVCAFLPKNKESFDKAIAAGFDEVLCDQAFW